MVTYYEVHNICKIEYSEEKYPFIELTTDSDFQYYFYLHQQITVVTDTDKNYKGVISSVEDTCFRIQTDNEEELSFNFSEIVGILGNPGRD